MNSYRLLQNVKIIPKRPRFLLRLLRNYLFLLAGRPVLRKGQIGLTYDCNCHCPHCSAAQFLDPERITLNTDEIKKVVDNFIRLGAVTIMLTGGEPTLRSDLEEIIEYINPDQAISCLLTNGRNLTVSRLTDFRKAGLGQMAISLDSPDPETHDRNRGAPGLFKPALELLEYGQSIGIYVQTSMIITRENIRNGEALEMVELTKKMGVDLNLLFASPVGRWTGEEDKILSDRDFQWVKKRLLSARHVRWEGYSSYWGTYCPAGMEKVHVTAYGDVIPCDFIQISFGNVREEPLDKIWRRMMKVKPFRMRQDVCICSLDREFIRHYLKPLGAFKKKPVPYGDLSEKMEWEAPM